MNLVEVNKNEVFCDSSVVAKKFGLKNAYVVARIKKVLEDIGDLRVDGVNPKCMTEEREYRGTKYTAYLMNRDFFSFLVMRFKGQEAIEWQLKFIAAFNAMEERIIAADKNATDTQWLNQREQCKIGRREETDVIKEFVDYATAQEYEHLNTLKDPHPVGLEMVEDLGMMEINGNRVHFAKYKCGTCGEKFESRIANVKTADTKECKSCAASRRKKTHGQTGTRIFNIWQNMIQRCHNESNPRYQDYGGRGIFVCDSWKNDFVMFWSWANVTSYNDKLTIERIDVDQGYFPENCTWIPLSEQADNKRGGLYKRKDTGKWVAQYSKDGIKHYLGQYDTREQAQAVLLKSKPKKGNATYKALGLMVQKKPKLRDTMDLYEISELILAERIARNSLKKYMDLERNYKDIYESVKDDLLAFGSGLRIE